MRAFGKIIFLLGVITALVFAGIFLPFAFSKTTNCGGNSAALNACHFNALELILAADTIGKTYNIGQLPQNARTALVGEARNHWIPEAKILIKTNINLNAVPKQIIAVCDTPYGNVPQPTIWNSYRKNPAHAVGYSDGSAGLITPAQFKELNISEFIDAWLIQTNQPARKNKTSSE